MTDQRNKAMNSETEALLKQKGITPTAMRILVIEHLQKQSAAVSLQSLESHFERADRTTLYRTLKTFQEHGFVHEIKDGSEHTKYALCAEACKHGDHYDLHLHFFCYSCEQTYCLPKSKIPPLDIPEKYKMKELNLVAKGFCEKCNR
jgi:Fur family ferric uptake transcriptional regulator